MEDIYHLNQDTIFDIMINYHNDSNFVFELSITSKYISPQIKQLKYYKLNLTKLSVLKHLPSLESIQLYDDNYFYSRPPIYSLLDIVPRINFSVLNHLSRLKHIIVKGCLIRNINQLTSIESLKSRWKYLYVDDSDETESVSNLINLTYLHLYRNLNVSTLKCNTKLRYLKTGVVLQQLNLTSHTLLEHLNIKLYSVRDNIFTYDSCPLTYLKFHAAFRYQSNISYIITLQETKLKILKFINFSFDNIDFNRFKYLKTLEIINENSNKSICLIYLSHLNKLFLKNFTNVTISNLTNLHVLKISKINNFTLFDNNITKLTIYDVSNLNYFNFVHVKILKIQDNFLWIANMIKNVEECKIVENFQSIDNSNIKFDNMSNLTKLIIQSNSYGSLNLIHLIKLRYLIVYASQKNIRVNKIAKIVKIQDHASY